MKELTQKRLPRGSKLAHGGFRGLVSFSSSTLLEPCLNLVQLLRVSFSETILGGEEALEFCKHRINIIERVENNGCP